MGLVPTLCVALFFCFVLFSYFIKTSLLFRDTLDHAVLLSILSHFLRDAGHPQRYWTLAELSTSEKFEKFNSANFGRAVPAM